MKYKGKQGNSYLFECEGDLCELTIHHDIDSGFFDYKSIFMTPELNIGVYAGELASYKDIQTAVSMMQILIEEGEV